MPHIRVIACDESGFEGEKLVGGVTTDFAHAAVVIEPAEAAECVAELRRRIRSPAQEYKANHLLREKNRAALLWLLGADGPVTGRGSVHLVDKTAWAVRAAGSGDGFAPLDLLGPAIVAAVVRWSADGMPVEVVHDRQNALTAAHLAAVAAAAGGRFAGLSFADSREDARVQVADFLAGVARRVAADRRAGRVDGELADLLLPYLGWSSWPEPWAAASPAVRHTADPGLGA